MSFGRHRHSSSLWRIVPITAGVLLIVAAAVMAVVGRDVRFLRLAAAFSLAVAVFSLLMFNGRERDLEREREDSRREEERLHDALDVVRAEAEEYRQSANEHAAMVEGQRAALAVHSRRIAELEAAARIAAAARERQAHASEVAFGQVKDLRLELSRLHAARQATPTRAAEVPAPAAPQLPSPRRFARAAEVLRGLAPLRNQQVAADSGHAEAPIGHTARQPLTGNTVRSTYAPVPIGPTAVVPAIAAQLDAVARRSGTFPGFLDPRVDAPPPDAHSPTDGTDRGTVGAAGDGTVGDALVDLTAHDETQRMDAVRATPKRRHA